MLRSLRVAAVQLEAHDRDAFELRWPHICTRIHEAALRGAQLIVLPEGTVPAYVLGHEPVASELLQAALDDVQSLARSHGAIIVYGTVRLSAQGLHNSAYVVDANGSLAGYADKCFLWHFDRQWFSAGSTIAPIDTSLGKLGVLICADGRIPTIGRALVDRGAGMLVMPTAWVTSGRNPHELENVQADLLAAVRARENGVPFVAANKVGVERACVAYCGKSQILGANGMPLAKATQHDAQTLIEDVTLGDARPLRAPSLKPKPSRAFTRDLRIAITPDGELPAPLKDVAGADHVVTADPLADDRLSDAAAVAAVEDDLIQDPGGLVPYRLAGYQLIVWRTDLNDREWLRALARARAIELRLFIIVVCKFEFAFAVDPDGTVVCGTFDGLRVAAFVFSPQRTTHTIVAPWTDILEGLQRVPLEYS